MQSQTYIYVYEEKPPLKIIIKSQKMSEKYM